MRLVQITIENYRSITKAYKIRLGPLTTLVGPNNEGKSNVLRALVVAMSVLTGEGYRSDAPSTIRRLVLRHSSRADYDWDRDFPLHLQEAKPEGESQIVLEFDLSPDEIVQFKDQIGSHLNGTLPVRISLGPTDRYAVTVAKQGLGGKALSAKSPQVAAFIADRLLFQHIPAVRTASSAEDVVRNLVDRELRELETHPEYAEALEKISELQQPILRDISNRIRDTLVSFLPAVTDVSVQVRSEERSRALRRSIDIYVDDGTATLLQLKGDGVQSLAAIGLMRHLSESSARGKSLVIAIEEPESHLHPRAIHDLHSVIRELSTSHQIVLTTHCPLFVDRSNPSGNVIVRDNTARPAKSIEEIRDVLGVRASDNLRHAELVLLVEGEDDRTALLGLLPSASLHLGKAMKRGIIAIDTLAGATNLAYKAGSMRDALCSVYVLLDNDAAGILAFQNAQAQGLVSQADVTFAMAPGHAESELEDIYDLTAYAPLVKAKFGVDIDTPPFKGKAKWSARMRAVFEAHGKLWNQAVEAEAKAALATLVGTLGVQALHPARRASFDALVNALTERTNPA